MINGYFWYSAKQADHYKRDPISECKVNYAIIDGTDIPVIYTLMTSSENHDTNWDDIVLLGHGRYSHSSGKWNWLNV